MTFASLLSNLSLPLTVSPKQIPYGWAFLIVIISIVVTTYSFGRGTRKKERPTRSQKIMTTAAVSPVASMNVLPVGGHVSVSKILLHPIKSCRGISVQSARYTPEGLENDRLWCIMDATKGNIITAREVGKMVLITPTLQSDGTLRVSFPENTGCESFSIPLKPTEESLKSWTFLPKIILWPTHDPLDGYIGESISGPRGTASAILSKYFEKPVHLIYKGPQPRPIDPTFTFPDLVATAKYQDMYPLLVLSEESTSAIEKELRGHVGTQGIDERWKTDPIPIERFRPNIVFRGGGAFAEDNWEEIVVGCEGSPPLTLVSKCTRCLLPNVSPETGERDKAVPFKVLMKFRTGLDPKYKMKACVGCNAVPAGDGTVNVGDIVYVKKMIQSAKTS